MKLIRELNTELIYESVLDEATQNKHWYISGVTLQSDIQNKNKRTYPKNVLSEAIKKHCDEFLIEGRALGELNHPDNGISSINLDRVSHKFTSVTNEGSDYITKAQVLDTPCGKIVQNLLEGGVKLGISSRGLGNIKQQEKGSLVENLYLISLGDIVGDPSAPNAFVQGVLEGVEWEMNKSGIIEKKVVEESLDKYSELIKSSSKEDLNEAVKTIFSDYLKKLKM
jgi:hypothetical protein